jgi:ferrochelatase
MAELPFDSVLLMGYGGPEQMADVRPFLDNILRGLPVPRERYETVVHHYERIGGRSPLNELTARQAAGLRHVLETEGPALPVYVGMRFARPYMYAAIRDLIRDGRHRAVGIVLAPYRSEPSFEKYQEAVREVLDAAGPDRAPRVEFVDPWFDHPLFAEAQADQVRAALAILAAERRAAARLVFTAHSIPLRMTARCPYVEQIETACRNVVTALGGRRWQLAWQSRSGDPRTPWLEPDVNDVLPVLKAEGTQDIVLCPVGFVSDHVEVLYDLDVEAAQICQDLELNMVRAASVNDHPTFLHALADLVRTKIQVEHPGPTRGRWREASPGQRTEDIGQKGTG